MNQEEQLSTLAHMMKCITEEELAILTGNKVSTLKAWRNRGTGPIYARFGNNFLYRVEDVKTYIDLIAIGKISNQPKAYALA